MHGTDESNTSQPPHQISRHLKKWKTLIQRRYGWILLTLVLLALPLWAYYLTCDIALMKAKHNKVWQLDPKTETFRAIYNYKDLHLYCPYGGKDGGALRILPIKDVHGHMIIPLNTAITWALVAHKGGVITQKFRNIFFHKQTYLMYTSVSKTTHEIKLISPKSIESKDDGEVTINQYPQSFGSVIPHYWVTGDKVEENLLIAFAGYQAFNKSEILTAFWSAFEKGKPLNLNTAEVFFRSRYPSSVAYYFKTSGEVFGCEYYLRLAGHL